MDTKPCPYCAEEIAAAATKCRFCNEWLDARAEGRSSVRWEGDDKLVVSKSSPLSVSSCLLCAGEQNVVPKERQFIYTPPWVYLGLLGGVIPAVVLSVAFQRRVGIVLPLCGRCRFRWTFSEASVLLFAVFGIFLLPGVGAGVGSGVGKDTGAIVGAIAGFVGWIVGVVLLKVFFANRSQAICMLVENDCATLRLPRPDLTRRALGGED